MNSFRNTDEMDRTGEETAETHGHTKIRWLRLAYAF